MIKVQQAKYLFIGVSCTALLAGCYQPDRGSRPVYQSSYSGPSGDARAYTYSSPPPPSQGAPSSQTDQQVSTGEFQSDRVVIPLHEEQVQVGKRTVETGQIRLRKQITTETVNQPVQIRKETIVVDREPASGATTTQSFQPTQRQAQSQLQSQASSISQPFEQGEIVIRLHSEEPVIEKRMVPAGNIVVETGVNNEQVNVQQQIRREKIDVDKGNGQNVTVSENLNQQSSSTRDAVGSPPSEPQRYQESTTTDDTSTTTRGSSTDSEYRTPVTTRENQPFPRPQPDGKETFPELKKNPEQNR